MTPDALRTSKPRKGDAHILRFRPRTSATAPGHPPARHAADAFDDQPDDFRHRMWVNLAGLICAVLLTGCGIWLATSMSEVRQKQDCVLAGRRDCAPISAGDRQVPPLRQH